MNATVYLSPCPICVKGKRCKGHAGDALLIGDRRVDVFLQTPRAADVHQGLGKAANSGVLP